MIYELKKDYNVVSDIDFFELLLLKKLKLKVKSHTKDNIKLLFNQFSFYETFALEDMICLLNLSMSRCNELLKLLLDSKLIASEEQKRYLFIK